MTTKRPTTSPRLTRLEGREVLSGNVTVSVSDFVLRITGDDLGNTVEVRPATASKFTVTGVGTTVNGGTAPVSVVGVNSIRVETKGGNDVIKVGGTTARAMSLPHDLRVYAGAGDDRIEVGILSLDDLYIDT